VVDTYGFSGIDLALSTGDTVALRNASGIPGLTGVVKFHWNGSGVEIVGNTAR
jgi:chitinase